MSLATSARLARRELRGGLAGFRIFLLCLALGVGAIAAVGTVRAAIESGLAREGRALLGGDAELRLTYRFADESERAWMASEATAMAEVVEFRSMAVTGAGERALTQVKAVDGAWPLIGTATFEPAMNIATVLAGRGGLPGAAMDPVLIDRLELSVGDTFRLGRQDFALMAAVLREPDSIGTSFGLGPRTLVAAAALENSGLIGPGTLFDTSYRLTLRDKMDALLRVGLGYIKVGQQATTLSGGEAQRVKLSKELARRSTGKTLYILDEPTTGLHFEDVRKLLEVLHELVDQGNTVVVIEHNLDVIKTADWIIDIGPEGGDGGGKIVAAGTPEDVAAVAASHTGQYLGPLLKRRLTHGARRAAE